MRRRLVALTAVPVLLLSLAACGEDSGGTDSGAGSTSTSEPIAGLEVSGEYGQAPEVTVEEPLDVDQSTSEVLVEGDGNEVVEGKQALLHLFVANGSNGEKALSTYDQGAPAAFTMSEDELFKSVVDAVVGQPVGSRVVLVAPPKDAFGEQGAAQFNLTADDDVVFVVDVMSVAPSEVLDGPEGEDGPDAARNLPTVEEKDGSVTGLDFAGAPKQAPKKLQVVTLVQGEGPVVRDDSLVTFDYLGQVWGSDEVFDESYSSQPRTFPVGIGGLIQAWDKAIVGAHRGSRLLILAPPEVAYGPQGSPPSIPPNATLAFVVDVLGVDDSA